MCKGLCLYIIIGFIIYVLIFFVLMRLRIYRFDLFCLYGVDVKILGVNFVFEN